ncbi:MAG: hypothetical protein GY778_13480 [bacterium]|nr:hypothetical protein [bacterium]
MPDHKCKPVRVEVKCGKISLGDHTISVPISISRDLFTLEQADHFLCDAQLDVELIRDAADQEDVKGQKKLANHAPIHLTGIVNVPSARHKDKTFSATLSFSQSAIDQTPLGPLANRTATLMAKRIGPAAATTPTEPDGDGDGVSDEERDAEAGQLRMAPPDDGPPAKKAPGTKMAKKKTAAPKAKK